MSGLQAVRRFARATNLVVAGRRFDVIGDGDDAGEIRRILVALGARPARDNDAVAQPLDQLWCTGSPDAGERALRALAAAQPGRPLVVIDAGSGAPALDLQAFGALHPERPGVVGLPDVSPDVFVVPIDGAAADAADEGGAVDGGAADTAAARIAWARRFMPVSTRLADELGRGEGLYGLRVAVSMVLEPKTAVLALLLRDAGAVVDVYAHADETDDGVAGALRREGLDVFASSTAGLDEQRDLALALLDRRPDLLLDDGSHVIRLAHDVRAELLGTMIGAAEETTSGLRPLRAMEARGQLRLPVVAVNDARTKTFFDNRYGTGQSCVFAILDLLDGAPKKLRKRVRAGSHAVVAGFGPVGEGVAQALVAAGLTVTVCEQDPVRALQAAFAGYATGPLLDAVRTADLVVSATGVRDTISLEVLRAAADGAIVAVAGGMDQEVAIDDAVASGAVRESVESSVDGKVERITWTRDDDTDDDHHVVLLDDGGCINITAGEGNPIEIMDLSFAVQLAAVATLRSGAGRLTPGVHPIDASADRRIAAAALAVRGVWPDADDDDEEVGADDPDPALLDTRTTRFGPLP